MAAISVIYSKRVYSSKLQHRWLVNVQPRSWDFKAENQLDAAVNQKSLQELSYTPVLYNSFLKKTG